MGSLAPAFSKGRNTNRGDTENLEGLSLPPGSLIARPVNLRRVGETRFKIEGKRRKTLSCKELASVLNS